MNFLLTPLFNLKKYFNFLNKKFNDPKNDHREH